MRRFDFNWSHEENGDVDVVVSIVSEDFKNDGFFLVQMRKNIITLKRIGQEKHQYIPEMSDVEISMVRAMCEGYYSAIHRKQKTFIWV